MRRSFGILNAWQGIDGTTGVDISCATWSTTSTCSRRSPARWPAPPRYGIVGWRIGVFRSWPFRQSVHSMTKPSPSARTDSIYS